MHNGHSASEYHPRVPDRFAIFIDAGFLQAEGSRILTGSGYRMRIDVRSAVDELRALAEAATGEEFLRAYWYDGAYRSDDPRASGQRQFIDAVALTPGLTVRLGTVKNWMPSWLQAARGRLQARGLDPEEIGLRDTIEIQKGVDTLIVLDLIRLAQKGAFSTAVLLAGDRDLLEAVTTVQEEGRMVVLTHPEGTDVDLALRQAADRVEPIPRAILERFLSPRPPQEPAPAAS